jgi:uncharacterized membrane protein YkoI
MYRVMQKVIIATLAIVWLTAPAFAGDPDCIGWSAAAPIIAKNSLLPAKVIYQMVQDRTGGTIVNQSLCEEGGKFVYKLVVLGAKGDVTNVTVDALTGQP